MDPELAARLEADRAAVIESSHVSRETIARLDEFVALLLRRQKAMNLIGASTIPKLWTRHIADSLQLLAIAPEARRWTDLGSGAGFPGVVIACAIAELPRAHVDLIEKSPKKGNFLRDVIKDLRLPALVHTTRIEDLGETLASADSPDVVTARALAPLSRLLEYVAPYVKRGAQALLLKGQDVGAELTEASKYWNIQADQVQSTTSPTSRILVIHGLERRSPNK